VTQQYATLRKNLGSMDGPRTVSPSTLATAHDEIEMLRARVAMLEHKIQIHETHTTKACRLPIVHGMILVFKSAHHVNPHVGEVGPQEKSS